MADDQALTIRLPRPLYEKLRAASFNNRVPMVQIIADALRKELEQQ